MNFAFLNKRNFIDPREFFDTKDASFYINACNFPRETKESSFKQNIMFL